MTKRLNVMLVDDEEIVCKRLKPAIEKMGCDVEAYLNPVEALKRIDEKVFDIVVTDVRMDEVDGLQMLDHVKQKSANTAVIVITGYAMVALAREAMAKGAFDFISKPFKPDDIRRVILKAAQAAGSPLDYQIDDPDQESK
jgi:DNA-binding NtrC family response regulator